MRQDRQGFLVQAATDRLANMTVKKNMKRKILLGVFLAMAVMLVGGISATATRGDSPHHVGPVAAPRSLAPAGALSNTVFLPVVTRRMPTEIGAFVDASPPTATPVTQFEGLIKRHLGSVMWYQGWGSSGQPDWPTSELNSALYHDGYNTHIILHLTWEPWVDLKDIANGAYDSYLTRYAAEVKAWGETIRLRFAHEMIQDNVKDNCQGGQTGCPEWYPWQDQPDDYKAAFRHAHDVFRAAGATNVEWVWCPNNYPFDVNIVKLYYPGPDYVDWLCMDGYNWTNRDGKPGWPDWQWFDDIFYNIYHTFVDHADIFGEKPVMIGEFASCEAGPSDQPGETKAAWIQNALERFKSQDYSRLQAFYWFQTNKECDWRVNSSSASLAAFRAAVGDPSFGSHP